MFLQFFPRDMNLNLKKKYNSKTIKKKRDLSRPDRHGRCIISGMFSSGNMRIISAVPGPPRMQGKSANDFNEKIGPSGESSVLFKRTQHLLIYN